MAEIMAVRESSTKSKLVDRNGKYALQKNLNCISKRPMRFSVVREGFGYD